MLRFTKILLAGAAVMALAACGSSEVASPGEGDFGGGTGGGGGATTPPPGTPATDCPAGFANVGVVAAGTLRSCQLPALIPGPLTGPLHTGPTSLVACQTQADRARGQWMNPLHPDGRLELAGCDSTMHRLRFGNRQVAGVRFTPFGAGHRWQDT